VVLNKSDLGNGTQVKRLNAFFTAKSYCHKIISISALNNSDIERLLKVILELLPQGEPFYSQEDLKRDITR
jgi:GTP-binding protein Era